MMDKVRDDELVDNDVDSMEGQVETFKEDVEEHAFLDTILADIGVEPMKVTADADWETATHANLVWCLV